jgi:hypothetical protein
MEKKLYQMIKDHQNDNGKLPSKQNIINFAKANS